MHLFARKVRQQHAETMMFWPFKGKSQYIPKVFCVACVRRRHSFQYHLTTILKLKKNSVKVFYFSCFPKNCFQSSILSSNYRPKLRKRAIKKEEEKRFKADQVAVQTTCLWMLLNIQMRVLIKSNGCLKFIIAIN